MDELETVLTTARPAVAWFAMGEAKRINEMIRIAISDYQTNKQCSGQQKKLIDAAKLAAKFLASRATNESLQHARIIRDKLNNLGEKML